MRRWLYLLTSLMLAVMLWTGNVAHAAEAFGCAEVSVGTPGHFDGDSDQIPADPDKGVPHHHAGGCHGHHNATSANDEGAPMVTTSAALPDRSSDTRAGGRGPPTSLRPPIA